jgi:hypothetical protein
VWQVLYKGPAEGAAGVQRRRPSATLPIKEGKKVVPKLSPRSLHTAAGAGAGAGAGWPGEEGGQHHARGRGQQSKASMCLTQPGLL